MVCMWYYGESAITSVHTCVLLYTPVYYCTHLYTAVHTCVLLYTPVYSCTGGTCTTVRTCIRVLYKCHKCRATTGHLWSAHVSVLRGRPQVSLRKETRDWRRQLVHTIGKGRYVTALPVSTVQRARVSTGDTQAPAAQELPPLLQQAMPIAQWHSSMPVVLSCWARYHGCCVRSMLLVYRVCDGSSRPRNLGAIHSTASSHCKRSTPGTSAVRWIALDREARLTHARCW